MAKSNEAPLMIISIFMGIIGITGLITVLENKLNGLTVPWRVAIFFLSALFIAISIALLKDLLD